MQLQYSRAFGGKDLKPFGLSADPSVRQVALTQDMVNGYGCTNVYLGGGRRCLRAWGALVVCVRVVILFFLCLAPSFDASSFFSKVALCTPSSGELLEH